MGSFVVYIVIAGIVSYIFKLISGFVLGGPILLWIAMSDKPCEELFESRPRLLLTLGVFNHATSGALYAFVIYAFSLYFVNHMGGNYWLYFSLSIVWALVAFSEVSGMLDVFFLACVCGIPVLWFAGPYFLLALWIILLIVFIPVYFKRSESVMSMYKRTPLIPEDSKETNLDNYL